MKTLQQETFLNEALRRVLEYCELENEQPTVNEIGNLRVEGPEGFFLHDPEAPQSIKDRISSQLEAQKSFTITTSRGDMRFSIGPCAAGMCCWLIDKGGEPRPI